MAAKMILKDAKAPFHLLWSSVRPRCAPSSCHGEFVHAGLRIGTPKTISDSDATVLRRRLFEECSLNSRGVTGVGPILRAWNSGNSDADYPNPATDSDDSDIDIDSFLGSDTDDD